MVKERAVAALRPLAAPVLRHTVLVTTDPRLLDPARPAAAHSSARSIQNILPVALETCDMKPPLPPPRKPGAPLSPSPDLTCRRVCSPRDCD